MQIKKVNVLKILGKQKMKRTRVSALPIFSTGLFGLFEDGSNPSRDVAMMVYAPNDPVV